MLWPAAAHLQTLPPGGCLLGLPCSPALGHALQLLVPGPGPGPGVALPGIALDAPLRAAASRALTHPHVASWGHTDNTESWRRWLSHRVRPLNASPLWNPPQSPGGCPAPSLHALPAFCLPHLMARGRSICLYPQRVLHRSSQRPQGDPRPSTHPAGAP